MEVADDRREPDAQIPSWLERAFALLASIGIAVLCLVVTITVVSRWLYKPLIPDDVLIVREIMVGVILLPLAAVTAVRGHIAVTIFTGSAGPKLRRVLSVLGHAIGLVLFGALLWAGAGFLESSLRTGDYHDGELDIPMWIGRMTFVLALGVCALRLLWILVIDITQMVAGRPAPADTSAR